jgi:hypothetical protein
MMTVEGERVWVPSNKTDLVRGLNKMGISKIAGVPLQKVPVDQLVKEYCRQRARIVQREHSKRRNDARTSHGEREFESTICQLKLFTA